MQLLVQVDNANHDYEHLRYIYIEQFNANKGMKKKIAERYKHEINKLKEELATNERTRAGKKKLENCAIDCCIRPFQDKTKGIGRCF